MVNCISERTESSTVTRGNDLTNGNFACLDLEIEAHCVAINIFSEMHWVFLISVHNVHLQTWLCFKMFYQQLQQD